MNPQILTLAATLTLAACSAGESLMPATRGMADPAAAVTSGMVRKLIPAEDPGPPFYARATPIMNEIFRVDEWLVIPFYRDPGCIPADFNLLELYHFPGEAGPGAFACPLVVRGSFLTEADASPTTFPRQVTLEGTNVPLWLVPYAAFEHAAADGILTITELRALAPIEATARQFHELLMPRMDDHRIVISAAGTLEDGRAFSFHVTHLQDVTRSISLRFH